MNEAGELAADAFLIHQILEDQGKDLEPDDVFLENAKLREIIEEHCLKSYQLTAHTLKALRNIQTRESTGPIEVATKGKNLMPNISW